MDVEPEPVALRRARLVVAYDGTGFRGFAPAVRAAHGARHVGRGGVPRCTSVRHRGGGRRRRGADRCRCACVGAGGLARPAGLDRAPVAGRAFEQAARPRDLGALGGLGRAGLQRPVRCAVAPLPVRRVELAGVGAHVRALDVARPPAAAAVGDAARLRPADRRARLRLVLPPAEGRRRSAGAVDASAGDVGALARRPRRPPRRRRARRRVRRTGVVGERRIGGRTRGRPRRRRPRARPIRDPSERVLPPDGALDRRAARRRRAGPPQRRRGAVGRSPHEIARGPVRSRHRTR